MVPLATLQSVAFSLIPTPSRPNGPAPDGQVALCRKFEVWASEEMTFSGCLPSSVISAYVISASKRGSTHMVSAFWGIHQRRKPLKRMANSPRSVAGSGADPADIDQSVLALCQT
jgi:hypothetical protein